MFVVLDKAITTDMLFSPPGLIQNGSEVTRWTKFDPEM